MFPVFVFLGCGTDADADIDVTVAVAVVCHCFNAINSAFSFTTNFKEDKIRPQLITRLHENCNSVKSDELIS